MWVSLLILPVEESIVVERMYVLGQRRANRLRLNFVSRWVWFYEKCVKNQKNTFGSIHWADVRGAVFKV